MIDLSTHNWYGMKWTEEDEAFMRTREEIARHICRVFGISPQELGVRVVESTIEEVRFNGETLPEDLKGEVTNAACKALQNGVGSLS